MLLLFNPQSATVLTAADLAAIEAIVASYVGTAITAIYTRLADADYTAPDNSGIAAIQAKLPSAGAKMAGEGATALNLDDVSVDLSGLPTLAAIEGSAVLAKEATVAAVKAKTDNLPSDPASEATVAALPDAATIAAAVMDEVV